MEPTKVAARFVAFLCFLNNDKGAPPSPEEAGRFARANWKNFLPYVREEWCELLESRPDGRTLRGDGFSQSTRGRAQQPVLA